MPTIGLSMIVKNGGEDLRACLNSVRGIVDQIVIADTGSTDQTAEIAKEFGATVVPCVWNDHYADARNVALAPMTTDWVLVLDADEELSPEAAAALPELVANAPAEMGGYQLTIRNYAKMVFAGVMGSLGHANTDTYERAKEARTYSEHMLCRLFRRHPQVYYRNRLHEVVELQILASGMTCVPLPLLILHYGTMVDQSSYDTKQHRYYRILKKAIEESPELSHLWVQLAVTERSTYSNVDAAIECARKAVAVNRFEYDGWWLLAGYLGEKKRHEEAIDALTRLPESGDWGIMKERAMGDNLHDLGRFKEARTSYMLCLERAKRAPKPLPMEFLAIIESRIGYTEVRIGMKTVGFRKLIHARDETPMVLSNHERLMKAYVAVADD
ncbi:MAG TPA: glycosyltransferase, partial [Edaphobacter sp.]